MMGNNISKTGPITESLKQAIKGYDTELQQKLILIICFTEKKEF